MNAKSVPIVVLALAMASHVVPCHASGANETLFSAAAGVVRANGDDAGGWSWAFQVTAEHLLKESPMFIMVRSVVGATGLPSDVGRDGNCAYAKADLVIGDLFQGIGGVGVYHLHAPFNSSNDATLDWGASAGGRFIVPYHHGSTAIFGELVVHRIFADEPVNLVAVTAGFTWPRHGSP